MACRSGELCMIWTKSAKQSVLIEGITDVLHILLVCLRETSKARSRRRHIRHVILGRVWRSTAGETGQGQEPGHQVSVNPLPSFRKVKHV
eukprot:s1460_g7.t1